MEITLGEKIKINGDEVPEYLLKALYENLKAKYSKGKKVKMPVIKNTDIACQSTKLHSYRLYHTTP